MPWIQTYDPLASPVLSTIAAALPIGLPLLTLGILRWRAQWAALTGLAAALLVSVGLFGMPVSAAASAAIYGAAYGLFPIGWIVLCAIFLYDLTVRTGKFEIAKRSVAHLSADRRVQAARRSRAAAGRRVPRDSRGGRGVQLQLARRDRHQHRRGGAPLGGLPARAAARRRGDRARDAQAHGLAARHDCHDARARVRHALRREREAGGLAPGRTDVQLSWQPPEAHHGSVGS